MKPAQYYRLLLNDMELGILQEFEEGFEREIKQQRSFRSNSVKLLQCGAESYTLHFKRILISRIPPSDLYSLHDFSLTLVGEEKTVCYTGCEFTRLRAKTDSVGTTLEEADVCACKRSVTEE